VTLIPEMAVPVETRTAAVSVSRFASPEPKRRVGMIWRRATPLASKLLQISGVVRDVSNALRGSNGHGTLG